MAVDTFLTFSKLFGLEEAEKGAITTRQENLSSQRLFPRTFRIPFLHGVNPGRTEIRSRNPLTVERSSAQFRTFSPRAPSDQMPFKNVRYKDEGRLSV